MIKENQILTKVEELERRLKILVEDFSLHNHTGSDTRKIDYKRLNNQPINNSKIIDGRLGGGGWKIESGKMTATNIELVAGAANTAHIAVGTGSNLAGINSGNAAGDIAFWAGDTFANRATADFFITMAGVVKAESITLETNVVVKDLQAGSVISGTYIPSLSVSKLVTGTISSKQITLGITGGTGDVYIAGGTFDATTWTATGGFILGIDDSDSDLAKFFIGNATSYLSWDGSAFVVKGASVIEAPALYELTAGEALTANDSVQMGLWRNTLFIPGDDARVCETNPGTNYGSAVNVIVGGSSPDENRGYVKFNFTGLPTGNLNVAIFYFYVLTAGTISISFYPVTSADWTEGAITWTNRPTGVGSQIGSSISLTAADIGTWKSIEMTSTVANWLSGGSNNYGFLVIASSANGMSFASSEHGTANQRCYLSMVFNNGKVFKADATVLSNTEKWIGFVTNSPSAEGVANVQLDGITTQSALGIGAIHYLSNTRGHISIAKGTITKRIGIAMSSTKLIIDKAV